MGKHTVVYPRNGILLCNKKESVLNAMTQMKSQMHYAKKPDSKGHILYKSIYRTFSNRQNYKDSKGDQW